MPYSLIFPQRNRIVLFTFRSPNGMQKSRLAICLVVGFLGVVSVATSIAAEFKRTKADQVSYERGQCTLPGSPALALGTTAATSILLAQLLANAAGGCICCCTKDAQKVPTKNRRIAMGFLVLSWMTFALAFFLLVAGSSMNQSQPYQRQWLDNECYVVKTGIFASAAALSLVTVIFDIVFFLEVTTKRSSEGLPQSSFPVSAVTPPVSDDAQNTSRNTNNYVASPVNYSAVNLPKEPPASQPRG